MELFSKDESYKLYKGNMMDLDQVIADESIDAVITDPPYEINFMNNKWDNNGVAFKKETWEKCYKVLKKGGYLLAFGSSRTFHRIAVAIEDAGFEIRDTIMWLYGSGFPKSVSVGKVIESKLLNGSANVKDIKKLDGIKETTTAGWNKKEIEAGKRDKEYIQTKTTVNYKTEEGKKWDGWGTALKPAYEPIIVARKPIDKTIVENVMNYGVGGLNIDECRVPCENRTIPINSADTKKDTEHLFGALHNNVQRERVGSTLGRFPANIILTYDETDEQEVCGGMPETKSGANKERTSDGFNKNSYGKGIGIKVGMNNGEYGDSGSASRYFYCAKASKKDRDDGLKETNIHPTVKPTELMQYLVRLVTPKGATILDCFNGSGSTGKAVMFENKERNAEYKYIGIEMNEEYLTIAKQRIESAQKNQIIYKTKEKDESGNEKEITQKQMTLEDCFIEQGYKK